MSKTLYDIATGRILSRSLSGNGGMSAGDNYGVVAGFYDPVTMYMPLGVPTARAVINYTLDKATITAAGGEVATVTGLPAGATIHFGADEYSADAAGSFSFDAETVGDFDFIIDEPEFLKTTIRITAI